MLAALLIFVLVGCFGLFAALRPKELYTLLLSRIPTQGTIGQSQSVVSYGVGDFWRLHSHRHSDPLSAEMEPSGPGSWAFILSRLRRGIFVVGNRTSA